MKHNRWQSGLGGDPCEGARWCFAITSAKVDGLNCIGPDAAPVGAAVGAEVGVKATRVVCDRPAGGNVAC